MADGDYGPIRSALEDHEPVLRNAVSGPVQNLPFQWLAGAGAPQERRAAANERLTKLLATAKSKYAVLKEGALPPAPPHQHRPGCFVRAGALTLGSGGRKKRTRRPWPRSSAVWPRMRPRS